MKQITFSDKQFYDLLQFTSEYTGNILERASEDWDSSYSQDLLEANSLQEAENLALCSTDKVNTFETVSTVDYCKETN